MSHPLYVRVLRLKHVRPSSWQRAVLLEGAVVVAVLLALADLASAWLILALPLSVAATVKGYDALCGLLGTPGMDAGGEQGGGGAPDKPRALR